MSEVPHYVRGSSLEIEISWFHFVVQQVLRALPAETKVDGLPRVASKRAQDMFEIRFISKRMLNFSSNHCDGAENELGQGFEHDADFEI